eukprot:SAG31_NODE_30832_length_375_cov_1.217391_1_plen_57_part_10
MLQANMPTNLVQKCQGCLEICGTLRLPTTVLEVESGAVGRAYVRSWDVYVDVLQCDL